MRILRWILFALLIVGVLSSSGCVYWRLLKLKNQLKSFSENFEFLSEEHYSVLCLNPILSGDDIDRVMKVAPSELTLKRGQATSRVYSFLRIAPLKDRVPLEEAGGLKFGWGEQPGRDLDYTLDFHEELFCGIHFPEEFNQLFPAEALRNLLEGIGSADVDRSQSTLRTMTLRQQLRSLMPDKSQVETALGKPTARWIERKDRRERFLYLYEVKTKSVDLPLHRRRAFGRFHFDEERLVQVDAAFAGRVFEFNIP